MTLGRRHMGVDVAATRADVSGPFPLEGGRVRDGGGDARQKERFGPDADPRVLQTIPDSTEAETTPPPSPTLPPSRGKGDNRRQRDENDRLPMGRRQAIAAGAAWVLAGAAPAPARRVVSLNPCLDAALLAVADPGQIAALSHFSREEGASSVGAAALKFPFVYESAEEVIAHSPDLVLASRHSSLATRNALRRLGVPVLLFATPDSIAGSLAQMMRIAVALGRAAQGRAQQARIEAALAAAAPPPGTRPLTALVYQRGGFSSGPGTLMDELLTRTGFTNAIVRYGITRTSNVPLEQVVADPPQVLLRGVEYPGQPGWGERIMSHPALARVGPRMRIVTFPQRLMYCGGPNLIEAAALLAAARRRASGGAA